MHLMITPFSLDPNVVPFIAKDEMPISYLFFGVSNLVETTEYKRHWTELNNKEIAIGDPETREHFADFTSPIFEQIETRRQKNNNHPPNPRPPTPQTHLRLDRRIRI